MSNKPLDRIYLQTEESVGPHEDRCWCKEPGITLEDQRDDWDEYVSRDFIRSCILKVLKENNNSTEAIKLMGHVVNLINGDEDL